MSVYKVIEIIGTSDKGWEEAAKNAIETAKASLKDMRIGEVKELDISIEDGKMIFRTKLRVSFKYQT